MHLITRKYLTECRKHGINILNSTLKKNDELNNEKLLNCVAMETRLPAKISTLI